jgi:hypothetical protein
MASHFELSTVKLSVGGDSFPTSPPHKQISYYMHRLREVASRRVCNPANLLNEQSIQVQHCPPVLCAKMMELKDVPHKRFSEVADFFPTSLFLRGPCPKASMVFAYL